MHELSLAQDLIEHIHSVAASENASKVLRIVVVIGPYSGVERTAFEFAFPFAAEGTLAEGAELLVEETVATLECKTCRASSIADPTHLLCSNCGSEAVEIKGGHEFMIREIELESK